MSNQEARPDGEGQTEKFLGAATRSPWAFVPLLYFMQAMPVMLVQEVSLSVYATMGVSNEVITRWTALIALPWTIKLLWGPLVDVNGTKRRWVMIMQALVGAGIIGFAFAMQLPDFFAISLAVLFVIAIFSATCDVATDGFYLLSLDRTRQAKFVGIISTCFRLGRLFTTGALVWFAGYLTQYGLPGWLGFVGPLAGLQVGVPAPPASAWFVAILGLGVLYLTGRIINGFTVPRPPADIQLVQVDARENWGNIGRTLSVVAVFFTGFFTLNAIVRLVAHGLSQTVDGMSVGFNRVLDLHGWVLPAADAHLIHFGQFRLLTGSGVQMELVQLVLAGSLTALLVYAIRRLMTGTPMGEAFGSFATQQGIWAILGFIMFYRLGEVMLARMVPLFILDSPEEGGLGLTLIQQGQITGMAGVIGIVLGGIAGGFFVAKVGLRRCFWPLAMCIHIPNFMYMWVARNLVGHVPPEFLAGATFADWFQVNMNLLILYVVAFVDQFGYGFGFAGYMVFLMWVAQRGKFKTSHYAIGTGLGALCIMLAGILAGVIQKNVGYIHFFDWVVVMAIPGVLMLLFIPLEKTDGRGMRTTEVD